VHVSLQVKIVLVSVDTTVSVEVIVLYSEMLELKISVMEVEKTSVEFKVSVE